MATAYAVAIVFLIGAVSTACAEPSTFVVMMQDSSMERTLTARSAVRFRPAKEARRGDVIVFEYPFVYPGRPQRELIARLIGLPGDRLVMDADGIVVNGQRLNEPYAKNQQSVSPLRIEVPAGAYFVLGDDRNNQRDSRWWGPLPSSKLLGVVL